MALPTAGRFVPLRITQLVILHLSIKSYSTKGNGNGQPDAPAMCTSSVSAEGEGFEPSKELPLPVFKTGAIGRSATPPGRLIIA
jgi:hypothetical protein